MHTESSGPRARSDARLERLIVLQLLSDDGERRWSRAELAGALDAHEAELDAAVSALEGAGVLSTSAAGMAASPAVRRLDELELIGI